MSYVVIEYNFETENCKLHSLEQSYESALCEAMAFYDYPVIERKWEEGDCNVTLTFKNDKGSIENKVFIQEVSENEERWIDWGKR